MTLAITSLVRRATGFMPLNADEEARVVRYLLGLATPAERSALERRLFEDDDWAEELHACEMELVRDYVCNRLSPHDHQRFEHQYLSNPGLRGKVEEAQRIVAAVQTPITPATIVRVASHWHTESGGCWRPSRGCHLGKCGVRRHEGRGRAVASEYIGHSA
jgi:hypothetical protein